VNLIFLVSMCMSDELAVHTDRKSHVTHKSRVLAHWYVINWIVPRDSSWR